MKNRNKIIYICLLLVAMLHSCYYLFVRDEILLFLSGSENEFLEAILYTLYPRFEVESIRFSPAFFLGKADQVILRTSICAVLLSFLYSRRFTKLLPEIGTTKRNISIVRILFFFGLMVLGREMYPDMLSLETLKDFYKPVLFLKIIPLQIPGYKVAVLMTTGFFVFCVLAMLDVKAVFSSSCAVLIFIVYQAFLYSFEKTEHAYATVNYAGFLMPFLIYESKRSRSAGFTSFFLPLIMLLVAGCYFLSGLEKLLIAGLDWLHPQTFRSYLHVHGTNAGLWLASNPFLTMVLPAAALAFQLSFICCIWLPKLRFFFITGGIFFHWGTVVLLGISSFINPWILPYVFFVQWDKIRLPEFFSRISSKEPAEHRVPVGEQ